MADIVIWAETPQATDNGDELELACHARCSGMDVQSTTLEFSVFFAPGVLVSTLNANIKAAGIAAAAASITVGALDKKTLLRGPVGL